MIDKQIQDFEKLLVDETAKQVSEAEKQKGTRREETRGSKKLEEKKQEEAKKLEEKKQEEAKS